MSIKSFENISFKGTFRPYQQSVLDRSEQFLSDGKINIVAAPGSGKTILGLELIRRQNSPCIIFSPTTTIRQQWGQRFQESFLPDGEKIDDYFSYDLNTITLLNSVTYQALHSCISKEAVNTAEEETDYSKLDIIKLVKESGVKTICLDESHHLQNEWQKSLETFIKMLDTDIVIISLTATPPYDASSSEWERYVNVCGEIDDEIFVPELVKDKTLCPHQDYILFNYPTESEIEEIKEKKQLTDNIASVIAQFDFIKKIPRRIKEIKKTDESYFYQNYEKFQALLSFTLRDRPNGKVIYRSLTKEWNFIRLSQKKIEESVQFMLDEENICKEEEKEIIREVLKKNQCISRNKVDLAISDKLQKKLVSSSSKLHSISRIALSEYDSLKDRLRMLVLADFIKKESLGFIGTDTKINNISIVSIFNELISETEITCGVISGSLVILPSSLEKIILKKGYSCTAEKIKNTDYSIFSISGGNKEKVNLASFIFEEGYINILIGTQALLGEGWDSPCINSLILASYVGSFMLSNQMRGRAIRSYKNDPDKTANIWHLITVDVDAGYYLTEYYDFETLKRRFECFVGPDYLTDSITNGIERIALLKPPYNREHIEEINQKMLEYSKERKELKEKWDRSLSKSSKIHMTTQIAKKFHPQHFNFKYYRGYLAYFALCYLINNAPKFKLLFERANNFTITLFILFTVYLSIRMLVLTYTCLNPIRSLKNFSKAVLQTYKDLGIINQLASLNVSIEKYFAHISLDSASIHEQNIFSKAMKELFSNIENPKYVVIKLYGLNLLYDYNQSFTCPEDFAKNKKLAKKFEENLRRFSGSFEVRYCHSERGFKILNKCKRHSNVQKNANLVKKIQKI